MRELRFDLLSQRERCHADAIGYSSLFPSFDLWLFFRRVRIPDAYCAPRGRDSPCGLRARVRLYSSGPDIHAQPEPWGIGVSNWGGRSRFYP